MELREGQLKPLHQLKVNQARKIKEAHHRHRGKAAGNFDAPFASAPCALANLDATALSISRKELQQTQMKATGGRTAKIIFRM